METYHGIDSGELEGLILSVVTDIKMDKVRLDKLIEAADDQDKITMKVLYNAVVTNLTAYNAQKTSARLKDWRQAESALLKSISELESKYFPKDRPLPNLLAVADWLKHHGWKVSKSKLYADAKTGKIFADSDGAYPVKSIEKYAGHYLRQKGALGKHDEALSSIAELKAKAEADKLRSQADMAAIKLKIAQGQYVEKEYFDRELAKRAAFFRNDLEIFCRSRSSEIIAFVEGDHNKAPDLIQYLLECVEDFFGRYAENREFSIPVTTLPEDDEDEEEEEI
ncbi:hypothetical protein SAMN04489760_1559 [Syntrophus gentianae]|uniref:Uncharacterized protein n=1 Tax=Syntrophus gentianae TaxID=43775 RepID=A0A1H8BJ64_9BACT|nr:hypothetical protein [Syntrophus gentianae]SEM82529.1 hypothetical protein SAMN04489760_1559 [Syntrophus gentianae]